MTRALELVAAAEAAMERNDWRAGVDSLAAAVRELAEDAAGADDQERCGARLDELACGRVAGHGGRHQSLQPGVRVEWA